MSERYYTRSEKLSLTYKDIERIVSAFNLA